MKRFDLGRLFALLCLVLPLMAAADTVKLGDGNTGLPLNTTDGVPTKPGVILPCEILSTNRCGVSFHDQCTVFSSAATTNAFLTGAGRNVARINFMSGTAASIKLYDALTVTGTAFYDNSAVGVTPSTSFVPPTVFIGHATSVGLTVVVAGTNPMIELCVN